MGPGTGLGVNSSKKEAMLLHSNDGYRVLSTEGGHAAFSPVTDD